jgi:hypothetical protein
MTTPKGRRREKMTAYKNYTGAWIVSDIVGNRYYVQTYYGYTKREALRLFRAYVKEAGK